MLNSNNNRGTSRICHLTVSNNVTVTSQRLTTNATRSLRSNVYKKDYNNTLQAWYHAGLG